MTNIILNDLPEIEPRKSNYTIDHLIKTCSKSNWNDESIKPFHRDVIEAVLCLANEVKILQDKVHELENR